MLLNCSGRRGLLIPRLFQLPVGNALNRSGWLLLTLDLLNQSCDPLFFVEGWKTQQQLQVIRPPGSLYQFRPSLPLKAPQMMTDFLEEFVGKWNPGCWWWCRDWCWSCYWMLADRLCWWWCCNWCWSCSPILVDRSRWCGSRGSCYSSLWNFGIHNRYFRYHILLGGADPIE